MKMCTVFCALALCSFIAATLSCQGAHYSRYCNTKLALFLKGYRGIAVCMRCTDNCIFGSYNCYFYLFPCRSRRADHFKCIVRGGQLGGASGMAEHRKWPYSGGMPAKNEWSEARMLQKLARATLLPEIWKSRGSRREYGASTGGENGQ